MSHDPAKRSARATRSGRELQPLTDIDERIVQILQDDGRLPFVDIACKLGIPEAKVRRTINRLLETGVIAITALANPQLLGLEAMAVVGIHVEWGRAGGALQDGLLKIRGIDYVATTSGRFQIMAEAVGHDLADLSARIDLIRALDGVVGTETFVYLELLHQDFRWRARTEAAGNGSPRSSREISPVERQLILALYKDGRRSFRQIARDLEVSLQRVVSAYSRLKATGLLRVMAVLNPACLGIDTMAWLGIRVNTDTSLHAFAASLAEVPEVDYVVICTGRFDVLVEVACTTPAHLAELIETRIGVADGVSTVESFPYLRLDYPNERVWSAGRVSALNF